MGEMRTISEHELRERLRAGENDVDPARLTTLADDALTQARRRQRTARTAATLSMALVVAAAGITASAVATHLGRPNSVSTPSAAVGQHGPVKLVTPIRLMPVVSASAGACETGGYPGTLSDATTTSTYCYHVDSAQAMSVSELAEIEVQQITAAGSKVPVGWEVELTFLDSDKAAFTHVTAVTVNRQLAVVVDGKVVTAPVVGEPLTTGHFAIINSFSQQSANSLLDQLTGR